MDVRPGRSPSGRTDPDHPLDSPEGWRPGNLTRNSPCPANLPKPWPQPVSNSLWRTSCITEGSGSSVFVSSLTVSRQA